MITIQMITVFWFKILYDSKRMLSDVCRGFRDSDLWWIFEVFLQSKNYSPFFVLRHVNLCLSFWCYNSFQWIVFYVFFYTELRYFHLKICWLDFTRTQWGSFLCSPDVARGERQVFMGGIGRECKGRRRKGKARETAVERFWISRNILYCQKLQSL